MKTLKRDYFAYAESDMYTTPGTANKLSARWKRKNRIKQLKHSLRRYKNGDFLFYREKQAYLLLQKLQRPTKKANLATWDNYTSMLLEIVKHINIALVDANFKAGICYEKTNKTSKNFLDLQTQPENK